MKTLLVLFLLLVGSDISIAADLKVGIYNAIPDIQGDNFATYKLMIEEGFNSGDHTVNAVVDYLVYDPYASDGVFRGYFEDDDSSFDLLEIDTARLNVVDDLTMDVYDLNVALPVDTLSAALQSVTIDAKVCGYPTLVCGNFLIGLSPGSEGTCPIDEARNGYGKFYSRIPQCKEYLLEPTSYDMLYGGKMNDDDGWYLPFIYLDGYIDVHGPDSIWKAIEELKSADQIVSKPVCDRLNWFISHCTREGKNYCIQDFDGSYVQSSGNVFEDIKNKKTVFYFGFSEKVALTDSSTVPYTAISWPFAESTNHMLQFTDALVVNKKKWLAANEDKRNAIREFIIYFTGLDLRRKIAFGEDLVPKRNRYLLQAIESFYIDAGVTDEIYHDIYEELKKSVVAPAISSDDRKLIQKALEANCLTMQAAVANDGRSRKKAEL